MGTARRGRRDLDVVRETLEMNLFYAWRLCEAFVPPMQRNRYGRIVHISSGMAALNDMGGSDASRSVEEGADTSL